MSAMTEIEARKRWCPFVRVLEDNREVDGEWGAVEFLCLASNCMAWTWTETEIEHTRTRVDEGEERVPSGEGWEKHGLSYPDIQRYTRESAEVQDWKRVRPNRKGFCRLAGPVTP